MSGVLVEGLRRRFYDPQPVDAVKDVSFEARAGEVFGLLGPNGAGKTTTLRILATLLRPDGGHARVAGHDVVESPREVRASIGYLSTSTGLYGRLTARELIAHVARLQGVARPRQRTDELMARFGIDAYADKRCERLSTGMKQKVSIARALVHDPPVLVLDEPTTGLDVLVSETLHDFIREARASGRCVLLSTHDMGEAERLCDRIAVIHEGRILAEGTLEQLRERTGEHYLHDIFVALVRA